MTTQKRLTIAHVTDIHIPPDDSLVRDIDTKKNFEAVLHAISVDKPDLIVFGGDLAAVEGEVEAYQWIEQKLSACRIPYLFTVGNHDNLQNLKRVFEVTSEHNEELFSATIIGEVHIIGLDSSKGNVSQIQLDWIANNTSFSTGQCLLFLHHPPVDCNCRFMDSRYPLANRDDVFKIIRKIPAISHIFCGHYHTEKAVFVEGKSIFITPSTMHQISQTERGYSESSRLAGWRKIECDSTGLKTSVHYLSS